MMQEVSSLKTKGNGGKVSLGSHVLLTAGLIYLVIPVIIFLFGWTKIYIAIPAALLLMAVSFFAAKDFKKDSFEVEFDVVFLVAAALFVILLSFVCDIGEYVWGTTDHAYRRALLRDLVDYDWPVIFDLSDQSDPVSSAYLGSGTVAFSYYVTFWMVPALAGKVLGFEAANVVLLLWSAAGLFITCVTACFFLKRQTYAILYALMFFSGMDFIPYLIYQAIGPADWMWLEGYTQHIAVISNINNLMNVFNQCIPCWLIMAMLLVQKGGRNVGLTGSLMFAYSPWATIGILPFAIWSLLKDRPKVKSLITLANIIPAVILLAVFAPLYTANSGAVSVSGFTFTFYDNIGEFIAGYLMTAAVEVIPFALLFWKRYGRTSLYKVAVATLLILPFYKISAQNDLTMRGTMPALFVLTVFLAGAVSGYIKDNLKSKERGGKDLIKLLAYFLTLVCMSMVAFQMTLITLVCTFDGSARPDEYIGSFGDINDGYEVDVIESQFFVHDYEDTVFYRYIARG